MELQALNRVHRIGQSKPVFVKRFIVQDTVEENMMAIQDKKQVQCLSDVFVLHILVSDQLHSALHIYLAYHAVWCSVL